MEMHELVAFAALQEKRFRKLNAGKNTELERTYAQLAKLGEEFGELCAAVMASVGDQRQDKLDAFKKEDLAGELADVTIVVFILAEKLGVDMPNALKKKIAVVNERFKHVTVE